MSDKKENIGTINLNSFFLMIILVSGLLLFHHADYNPSDRNNNPVPVEISLIQNNAIVCPGIQIDCFQQIWISNKDNFQLLTFDKIQYLENRKTDQKITLLENTWKNSIRIPNFYLLFHLFPSERDELPVLS
jgi:hypothetical protein